MEIRSLAEHVAGLIDEDGNRKWLIGIRVHNALVSRTGQFKVRVDRLIDLIGIVGRLIGPILQAERNELGRNVVAQFCGTEGIIRAGVGRVASEVQHGGLEQGEGCCGARAVHEPMVQQTERRMADGRFLGQLALGLIGWDRQQCWIEGSGIPLEILTQKNEGVEVIVRRKRIETGHGEMEQVPGVNCRSGEVPPNRLQQVFIPLPRHSGLDRHGPSRLRRTIGRRARLSPSGNRGQHQTSEGRKDKHTNGHITI